MDFLSKINIILNENNTLDEVVEILKTKCKPFVSAFKAQSPVDLLYRGIKNPKNGLYSILNVRKDRKPLSTPESVTKILDAEFLKYFGIKARTQTLFCTGLDGYAKEYGALYSIFPIGDFDLIWSPEIIDLFVTLPDNPEKLPPDEIIDLIDVKNNYKRGKNQLKKAIASGYEIMVVCDSYLAVKMGIDVHSFKKDLIKIIKSL